MFFMIIKGIGLLLSNLISQDVIASRGTRKQSKSGIVEVGNGHHAQARLQAREAYRADGGAIRVLTLSVRVRKRGGAVKKF